MNRAQAIEHFGSQTAIADALGIKPPAVSQWGDDIPAHRQIQLERISGGALKADPSCYGPQPSEQAA